MARIPPALVMQVVGTFAWLLVGAMARPGAAQEPAPAAAAPSFADVVSPSRKPPSHQSSRRPVHLERSHRVPVQSGDPGIDLRQARSGHLAAVAVLDPLQRRLARALGAIAQRLGRRARQGWINATDGNLYRLWFFTFAQAFNQGPKGNAYLGAYTLFTPLSRRLVLITNIPFVVRNNAGSGLPIISPTGLTPPSKNHTTFGDLSFTPRVLLHETQDFSLTAEMAVLVPTGDQPLAGKTALIPAFAFWNNFAGRWVIRGGIGDYIPLGGGGTDNLISQLAIGQTLTDHDVPLFGDFTWYVSTVVNTPLSTVNIPA